MFLPSAYYIFSQGTLCTFFSDGKLAFRCAFLGTQGFRWTLFRLPVGVEGSLFLDCSVKLSWALSARETKGDLSDCFPNDRQAEHGQRKQPCVSIYSSVSFVTRLTEQGLYGQVIGLIHRWQKGYQVDNWRNKFQGRHTPLEHTSCQRQLFSCDNATGLFVEESSGSWDGLAPEWGVAEPLEFTTACRAACPDPCRRAQRRERRSASASAGIPFVRLWSPLVVSITGPR